MSFADSLCAAFPIRTERFALLLVDPATDFTTNQSVPGVRERADGSTIATIQLIVYEETGGKLTVRDIKEQEVVLLKAKHRADPRVDAYVTGWRDAVLFVMKEHEAMIKRDRAAYDRFKGSIEYIMPHDLCVPEVLDLTRPRDADAFTGALLSGKKRFGQYLP